LIYRGLFALAFFAVGSPESAFRLANAAFNLAESSVGGWDDEEQPDTPSASRTVRASLAEVNVLRPDLSFTVYALLLLRPAR
jgi:hypothetical protein